MEGKKVLDRFQKVWIRNVSGNGENGNRVESLRMAPSDTPPASRFCSQLPKAYRSRKRWWWGSWWVGGGLAVSGKLLPLLGLSAFDYLTGPAASLLAAHATSNGPRCSLLLNTWAPRSLSFNERSWALKSRPGMPYMRPNTSNLLLKIR